uniref:Interleukin family protein n=1 Tax=Oreochromis aureus TaxID=47969 RepID=A0A668VKW3_OREAU
MKMLLGCSASFLLLLLLSCLTEPAESRTLHLDSCSVSVHTHELRKYYAHIRSNAVSSASSRAIETSGKNLHKCNVRLNWQKDGQTCCFLRLVLRFYVERVFSNYASSEPEQQRCSSALANAFVSIRRDIHKCHCQCGEETQRTIDSVHAEFIKLQANRAAQKAVGELDTVLEWLEALGPKTQRN